MAVEVHMKAELEDGSSLQVLEQLIAARMAVLKQSAKQALDATAVTLVKSLRAATKTAKVDKTEIEDCQGLVMSFYSHGKEKPKPCIRWRSTKMRFYPPADARIRFTASALANSRCAQIWTFKVGYESKQKTYYIAATSLSEAKREAKAIVKRRIEQYKGLAKLAWGVLGWKIASSSIGGAQTTPKAGAVAREQTRISRVGDEALVIEDNLDYAELAFKHGKSDIDIAAQKAANQIAAIINKSLDGKGLSERIDIPFPKN